MVEFSQQSPTYTPVLDFSKCQFCSHLPAYKRREREKRQREKGGREKENIKSEKKKDRAKKDTK